MINCYYVTHFNSIYFEEISIQGLNCYCAISFCSIYLEEISTQALIKCYYTIPYRELLPLFETMGDLERDLRSVVLEPDLDGDLRRGDFD